MKGIYEQMREVPLNEIKKHGIISEDDVNNLSKLFKKIGADDIKRRKIRLKEIEDNYKSLKKRSKELGKEIPFELYWVCCDYTKHYIGSRFLEKYKEWL